MNIITISEKTKSSEKLDLDFIIKHYDDLSFPTLLKNPHLSNDIKLQLPFIYFNIITKHENIDLSYIFESIIQLDVSEDDLIKFFRDWNKKFFKLYPVEDIYVSLDISDKFNNTDADIDINYKSKTIKRVNIGNILETYVNIYYKPLINFPHQLYRFYNIVKNYITENELIKYFQEYLLISSIINNNLKLNKQEWLYLIHNKIIEYFPDYYIINTTFDIPRNIIKIFYEELHHLEFYHTNIYKSNNLTWKEYDVILTLHKSNRYISLNLNNTPHIPFWFIKKYFPIYRPRMIRDFVKTYLAIGKYLDLQTYIDLLQTVRSASKTCKNAVMPDNIIKITPHIPEEYICYQVITNKPVLFNLTKILSSQSLQPLTLEFLISKYKMTTTEKIFMNIYQHLTPYLINKYYDILFTNYLMYNSCWLYYPHSDFASHVKIPKILSPIEKVNLLVSKGVSAELDTVNDSYIIINNCFKLPTIRCNQCHSGANTSFYSPYQALCDHYISKNIINMYDDRMITVPNENPKKKNVSRDIVDDISRNNNYYSNDLNKKKLTSTYYKCYYNDLSNKKITTSYYKSYFDNLTAKGIPIKYRFFAPELIIMKNSFNKLNNDSYTYMNPPFYKNFKNIPTTYVICKSVDSFIF
jgi:hypothetical protein